MAHNLKAVFSLLSATGNGIASRRMAESCSMISVSVKSCSIVISRGTEAIEIFRTYKTLGSIEINETLAALLYCVPLTFCKEVSVSSIPTPSVRFSPSKTKCKILLIKVFLSFLRLLNLNLRITNLSINQPHRHQQGRVYCLNVSHGSRKQGRSQWSEDQITTPRFT